jgi:hypothetical protein
LKDNVIPLVDFISLNLAALGICEMRDGISRVTHEILSSLHFFVELWRRVVGAAQLVSGGVGDRCRIGLGQSAFGIL